MRKTYKFKLCKSKKNKYLNKQINVAGIIYNHCIALHKSYYRIFHKRPSVYTLQKHLAKLKKQPRYVFWNILPAHAIQNIPVRIERAYKLFFENLKKHKRCSPPKFKKIIKYKSFTYNMPGRNMIDGNKVKLAGRRSYKFFKSREIEGTIKEVTVKRDYLGDIYIFLSCEVKAPKVEVRTGKSAGFDFGLKTFLVGKDKNEDVISPLFFRQNANAIKAANKKLSRKQKGSRSRWKAKCELARLHRRITNLRNEFHWKTAEALCREYSTICLEDLNLKGMQKRYGRKISDLGFGDFIKILEYVASKNGTRIVKIGRFYPSSQLCHDCGYQNKAVKDTTIREWTCPSCGKHHDRDRNAAKNILSEGLRILSA